MAQASRLRVETNRQSVRSDPGLDQVLEIIRGLDSAARSEVARVLAESEMDPRFEQLIRRLAKRPPVDEISDAEIQAEVNAVRRARVHPTC